MFHTKESPDGVKSRYYVTKDGRAIKLNEPAGGGGGQVHEKKNMKKNGTDPFRLPGIQPLVSERDIRELFYKLYDQQSSHTVGVNHSKDVDYVELRRTR